MYKNWKVRHGANFIEFQHNYDGISKALMSGDHYCVIMPVEAAEALIAELQEHVQAVKDLG